MGEWEITYSTDAGYPATDTRRIEFPDTGGAGRRPEAQDGPTIGEMLAALSAELHVPEDEIEIRHVRRASAA